MILNTTAKAAFGKRDHGLFYKVVELLIHFTDYAEAHRESMRDPIPECHSICRALAKMIPGLKVVDGNYIGLKQIRRKGKTYFKLRYAAHTWLVTPGGAIIDPYPIGFFSANPVMVVGKGTYKPFGQGHYMPDKSTTKTHVTAEVLFKARELTRLFRQTVRWKKKMMTSKK